MEKYEYRPIRFYAVCFVTTWTFWIAAAIISKSKNENGIPMLLMLLGLMSPAVTAVITVLTSKSKALKQDLKRKIIGFYRINPLSILVGIIGFMGIVILSILLSLLFGQSIDQFSFTEDSLFRLEGLLLY